MMNTVNCGAARSRRNVFRGGRPLSIIKGLREHTGLNVRSWSRQPISHCVLDQGPTITGGTLFRPRSTDVAVILDTEVLKLPLIGAADFFYDEFVFRQVAQTSCLTSIVQCFVLFEVEIDRRFHRPAEID